MTGASLDRFFATGTSKSYDLFRLSGWVRMNDDSVYLEVLKAALTGLAPNEQRIVQRVIEIMKSEPDSAKAIDFAERVLADMHTDIDDGGFGGHLLDCGYLLIAPTVGIVATFGAAVVAIAIGIFLG